MTESAKRVDGSAPRHYCDEALEAAGIKPAEDDAGEKRVAELAKLTELAYQKRRAEDAAQLNIGVAVLDKLVRKQRAQAETGQGRKVEAPEVKPWVRPVNGAELLEEISAAIRAHIVLTKEQADTVALFSVYTHAYEVFKVAPRLGIRAPTRECGKSELLLRIQRFVPRPLSTENLTGPVLFRLIELQHPTLFVDEFDNLLSDGKSELLGLLNSGYARTGKSHRLVEVSNNHELREFSTFCPLIYGMIGKPIDSFNSRSIPIEMRRATPAEWRNLLSLEDGEEEDQRLLDMGRKAARWVTDNLDKLKAAKPDMGGMVNRPATNWKPLYAVAEVAGGDWKARARAAAGVAAKLKQSPVEEEELFAVIKASFAASTKDYIESETLARTLAEVDGGPWAEYGKTGKPITTNALARLLGRFWIRPGQVGPEEARKRGYARAQFDELFGSYVSEPLSPSHPLFNCPSVQNAMDTAQVEGRNRPAPSPRLDTLKITKPAKNGPAGRMDTCNPPGGEQAVSFDEEGSLQAAKIDPPDDLPELADGSPPTTLEATEATPPRRSAEPDRTRAPVVSPKTRPTRDDPWADYPGIPDFLLRKPNGRPNPPALGPPGDSLDDFNDH